MKKMLALLVVLTVLGMCAPSFGDYVLVYKAIISGKLLNVDENTLKGVQMKAFLVMDIVESDKPDVNDTSGDASLVLYDRVPGPKRFATIDMTDSITLKITPSAAKPDLIAVSMGQNDWWAMLTGNLKVINVGLTGKSVAPTSLSGRINIDGVFFEQTNIMGSADIVANLDKSLTKEGNKTSATVSDLVDGTGGIVDMLKAKGFIDITP